MRTRVIVHLDRFERNFQVLRGIIGKKTRICVPVKADGYGHGAPEIAKISIKLGAYCLGVATAEEGKELRNSGIEAPILLLSQSHYQDIPLIINCKLIPFVSDIDFINMLNERALSEHVKLHIHLKIDTGMGRIGCSAEDAVNHAKFIMSCKGLELAGTATHFSSADSKAPQDMDYTKRQLECFNNALSSIRNEGIDTGIVHAANSGAVILHPDSWYDMVRPGIFLYGYSAGENVKAEPVMEIKSAVVLIKKIKKGESVSYERKWTASGDTTIAVLPVGYADGLPRLVSGNWQVTINGDEYQIAGRISMDQCCVNLGPETNVRRWDEAVIMGGSGNYDAAELARRTGTIPYEITCGINKRVPRVYEY